MAVPPGTCATDCLDAGYEGTYAERSIPLAINGMYSGPGIGFASCEDDCDLIIFANNTISGLNNTCDGQLGLQMYSTYYLQVNLCAATSTSPVYHYSFSYMRYLHGFN